MAEISTEIIMTGITLALHKAFPESKVHVESVEQGLAEGDILVTFIGGGHTSGLGTQSSAVPDFDIAYFGHNNLANIKVTDKLIETLKFITLPTGDMVRGIRLQGQPVDGVLHVTVAYPLRLYNPAEPVACMNKLEVHRG